MDSLQEIVDWARQNTEITHYEPSNPLICGKFSDRKFRIFCDEGWAGVIQEGDGWGWRNAIECKTLVQFKKALDYYYEIAAQALLKLTDEERVELFREFCAHCGRVEGKYRCQCWNDE